jgi:hypothetical protein
MVKTKRRIKLYALGVSVFAHIAALTIFAAVKISQTAPVRLQTTATVNINQAVKLADSHAVTPKPKVNPVENKPFDYSGTSKTDVIKNRPIAKQTGKGPAANTVIAFDLPKGNLQQREEFNQPMKSQSADTIKGNESAANIEFFDSPAQGRRICYVVDCSGSMRGLWKRVQEELVDSIGKLQQDYYFCVIVFGGGSILESGGGKMVRATESAKKEAGELIAAVRPRGGTNAADALERAIMVKDKTGAGASAIYFLTDGFELSEQDGSRFAHKVATLHRSFAPKTQINTIGFWCGEQDGSVLEAIAKESGGKFVMVGSTGEQKDGDK